MKKYYEVRATIATENNTSNALWKDFSDVNDACEYAKHIVGIIEPEAKNGTNMRSIEVFYCVDHGDGTPYDEYPLTVIAFSNANSSAEVRGVVWVNTYAYYDFKVPSEIFELIKYFSG